MIKTTYEMENDCISKVRMESDGLYVRISRSMDNLYEYSSKSRGEDSYTVGHTLMSLPTCLLHAYEFFGVLVPGTVTDDLYSDCEYEF